MTTAPELQRSGTVGTTATQNGDGLPEGSLADSLRFVATGVLPSVARGLFAPRPRAMKWLTRLNTDRRAIATLAGIREKHGGEGVRLLGGKLTVLWGEGAIREVLDNSATTFASDAGAKKKGMSHFQPHALTLSRGDEWRDRRAFNETVLATGEQRHPHAARMLDVVADEVARVRIGDELRWQDWERLFDRITLRVIFGNPARGDQELTQLLEKLMAKANRIAGLKTGDDYHEFYGRLERYLANPDPDSLIARSADAPQTDTTRVVHQIPHWIFAMRDTLGANTYRALALIVSHPEIERRVHEEIEAGGETPYLQGVLHEAMRLWPTTPLLAREVTRETTVAGTKLAEGSQLMLVNVFNHRDPDDPSANQVQPERWQEAERSYRFNHLSNGSQDCPGGPLVFLLGCAVLARVLQDYELGLDDSLLRPGEPLPEMLDFFSLTFKRP